MSKIIIHLPYGDLKEHLCNKLLNALVLRTNFEIVNALDQLFAQIFTEGGFLDEISAEEVKRSQRRRLTSNLLSAAIEHLYSSISTPAHSSSLYRRFHILILRSPTLQAFFVLDHRFSELLGDSIQLDIVYFEPPCTV